MLNPVRIIQFFYAISTMSSLFFLLWTLNKGFDYTDEGMYLLVAQNPNDINVSDSMFFKITSLLYKASFHNIVIFRVFGLIILLASSFLLYIGISKYIGSLYLKDHFWKDYDILLLTINGTLLYYVLLPDPSYNLLNVILIYSGMGLSLIILARANPFQFGIQSILPPLFLGWVVTLDFFFKFPSSILLMTLIISIFIIKKKNYPLLFLLLGSILSILSYFFFIQDLSSWKKLFFDGILSTINLGREPILSTLVNNLTQILSSLKHSTYFVLPLLIPIFVYLLVPQKWSSLYSKMMLLFVLTSFPIIIVHYKLYQGGWWPKVPSELILSFILVSSSLLISHRLKSKGLIEIDFPIFLLFLICVPFVGAIGTSVPIMGGVIECLATWPVVVYFLNQYLAYQFKTFSYNMLTVYLMIAITTQLITSKTLFPNRLNTSILEQTVPISIGKPPTVIQVDSKMAKFLNSLQSTVNKNQEAKNEQFVLAFCDMPGFVFFLGKRSPGFPWYFGLVKNYNNFILERTDPSLIKQSIIITNPEKNNCMPDLQKFGIEFPGNYNHIGHLEYPRLWWNVDKAMIPIDIWVPNTPSPKT